MRIDVLKMLCSIHYGYKEQENRSKLEEFIKHNSFSKEEEIVINVLTHKLPVVVTDFSFAEPVKEIESYELLAVLLLINPDLFTDFIKTKDLKHLGRSWHEKLYDPFDRKEHIQEWMNQTDVIQTVFDGIEINRIFATENLSNYSWMRLYRLNINIKFSNSIWYKGYVYAKKNSLDKDIQSFLKIKALESNFLDRESIKDIKINFQEATKIIENRSLYHLFSLILEGSWERNYLGVANSKKQMNLL